MEPDQTDSFPADTSNDELMEEFARAWAASREYMLQRMTWQLWDAGKVAQQLEEYLQQVNIGDNPPP
jgi:hypothetical protein